MVGVYYLRLLWLLYHAQPAHAYRVVTPLDTEAKPESKLNWVETDILLFIISICIFAILCGAMFLAYILVKLIITYKYDTCTKCYTKILLMCMNKQDSLNITLTTIPLPLACIKVVTLPHPQVMAINKVGCFLHEIQLT